MMEGSEGRDKTHFHAGGALFRDGSADEGRPIHHVPAVIVLGCSTEGHSTGRPSATAARCLLQVHRCFSTALASRRLGGTPCRSSPNSSTAGCTCTFAGVLQMLRSHFAPPRSYLTVQPPSHGAWT